VYQVLTYFHQDPEAFEREYTALVAPEVPTATSTRRAAAAGDLEETDEFTTVGRGGRAMQFTADGIFKHLQSVQEARGKKVCL
jgi:translation initiation factor 3 subunit C